MIELHEDDIGGLVRRGVLAHDQRNDRAAVITALYALFDQVFVT